MSGEASDAPILRRICRSLRAIYGDRIERLVLFGSRARGDAHAESDYDVAVFLEDLTDRWREFHRPADPRDSSRDRRFPGGMAVSTGARGSACGGQVDSRLRGCEKIRQSLHRAQNSPSPRLRGEGWGEGPARGLWEHASVQAGSTPLTRNPR